MEHPPYLGVGRSLTGRRWIGPSGQIERIAEGIAQITGLPGIVARLLASAGVSGEQADSYLSPTLRALMPDPASLADMNQAASRLTEAVLGGQRVAIFGDYDVDGAAAVALLALWLRGLGIEATIYIPDRVDEGYGPNVPAMQQLGAANELVLCVDCGTLSHAPIAAARAAGADVIVADHHLPGPELPDAITVNPNRADDSSGLGHLCAAGVVFLMLVAGNRVLRTDGHFGGSRREPDLLSMLDLVAIATVADVAPMIGLNRAFVRQGLTVMARRARPGLVALADVAGLSAPPTAGDLGFTLGPRINAGGRIGAADLGARLLLTEAAHEAEALAEKLDRLNTERRAVEAAVLDAAIDQAEARGTEAPLVWAAGAGWHPGVLGIVASRLKDRFNRPAIVIGIDGDEAKGSGRSIPGIDLGTAIVALTVQGLLDKGGGHRMAAGLSVTAERIEPAMQALSQALARQGADRAGPRDLILLGSLDPAGATPDLIAQLDAAGPFGPSNPAPRIAFPNAVPSGLRIVGTGHAQFQTTSPAGRLATIAFRAVELGLAEPLEAAALARAPLHLAGRLEIDDWGGRRKAKLRLEDIAQPNA